MKSLMRVAAILIVTVFAGCSAGQRATIVPSAPAPATDVAARGIKAYITDIYQGKRYTRVIYSGTSDGAAPRAGGLQTQSDVIGVAEISDPVSGGSCEMTDPNGALTGCTSNCSGSATNGVVDMTCYTGSAPVGGGAGGLGGSDGSGTLGGGGGDGDGGGGELTITCDESATSTDPTCGGTATCDPTANPVCGLDDLVAINKVAQYGDQCTKDAEFVGHPVPPYADSAHGITQEYPIGLKTSKANLLIGYVYTTLGGEAYFEPVSSAAGIGVVSISADASIDVGPNSGIKGIQTLGPAIVAKIKSIATTGDPFLLLLNPSPAFGACFSGGDWNGVVPA